LETGASIALFDAGAGASIAFDTTMQFDHERRRAHLQEEDLGVHGYTFHFFGDKYSIFGFYFVETMILNLRYFMDFGLKSIFLGGLQ